MNKRSMIRLSIIGILFAVVFMILVLSSSGFAFIEEKESFVGDSLRLDLSRVNDYVLRIETPTQTLLKEGSNDIFVFEFNEIGKYNFKINSEDYSESYGVDVLSKTEGIGGKVVFRENDSSLIEEDNESFEKEIFNEDFSDKRIIVGKPVLQKKKIIFNESVDNALVEVPFLGENFNVRENNFSKDFEIENSLTNRIVAVFVDDVQKELVIENVRGEVVIEYETPAPEKKEKEISKNKKEVVVSADDSLGYENVLAFSNLSRPVKNKEEVRIFWRSEGIYIQDYKLNDSDNDGFYDSVSWIVPHLSTQEFEIIVINKAEHLDSERNFIENIYEDVKKKDNLWTIIPKEDYVRIVFEESLKNGNDITIYAKGSGGRVEIFEKDSNERLAEFEKIDSEKYYKIILENLTDSQDTFDLLILDSDISFDYIVDPAFYIVDSDSFEDQDWNSDNGETWQTAMTGGTLDINNERAQDGSWSMRSGNAAYTEQNATLAINTTDYTNITVSYYKAETGTWEATDCFYFEWTSDGASWNNEEIVCDDFPNGATFVLSEFNLSNAADNNPNFAIRFIHDNPTTGDYEEVWVDNLIVRGYRNYVPGVFTSFINSTTGGNYTTDDLNCFGILSDADDDLMNVSVNWYKDDVLNLTVDYNNSYSNGSFFNAQLSSGNTGVGENWTCSLRVFDGFSYSFWDNSSVINILDAPSAPVLNIFSPSGTIADVTPLLNLTIDQTADTLWYNVNGGENFTLCNYCSFAEEGIYLEEGNSVLNVYANNSGGGTGFNSTSVLVDLNNNYFDTYLDNFSIEDYGMGINWSGGEVSFLFLDKTSFFDNFDDGSLGSNWTTYSSNSYSRIGVRTEDAYSGSYSVIADSDTNGNYELSELITDYDFTGAEDIILSFYYREFDADENNNGADHLGHDNSDAVYFTCDGDYWYHLMNLFGTTSWQQVNINISADPDFCSGVNSNFAIKFTQYDNYDINYDGIGWDDINISYFAKTNSSFASYPINTTDIIVEFTNVSWNTFGEDAGNSVGVRLSADNGDSWFNAVNGEGLSEINAGTNLVYEVLFSGEYAHEIDFLDLSISWTNSASPPPEVTINSPSGTIADVTPYLNITLNGTAKDLWYSLNNGATNYSLCSYCNSANKLLYLSEGDYDLIVYADNAVGETNFEYAPFTVYMDYNYFDTYSDNSSMWTYSDVFFGEGNVSYLKPETEVLFFEPFIDAGNWTLIDGNWIISSEMLMQNSNTRWTYAINDYLSFTDGENYNIFMTSYDDDNDENGIVFRYINSTDFYKCSFTLDYGDMGIVRTEGGVATTIATATGVYTENSWNDYSVTVVDNNISCYLNGDIVASVYDDTWEDGKTGIDNSFHQNALYDNFTIESVATGNSGEFTSYPVNTLSTISEITNIEWNSYGEDATHNVSVNVSADDGAHWYPAANGKGLVSITSGTSLVYKVSFFSDDGEPVSLLDMNISWTDVVSPAPDIVINSPSGTIADVTPYLNVSLSGIADTLWYKINGGGERIVCSGCSGNIAIPIVLEEGNSVLNVYANNSQGSQKTNSTSVLVDMDKNYFDSYLDNTSIEDFENVGWNSGELFLEANKGNSFFDNFDDGSLGSNWTTYSSNPYSNISIRTESSYSGSYSVIADSTTGNQYELSELITNYDFSGAEDIYLSFYYYDWSDENNNGADHSGHYNSDAVYFTCDGNYWYHLMNLFGAASWQLVNINVSADPDFCEEVNESFAIKFTQYDNFPLTNDGIGWDDVNISYNWREAGIAKSYSINTTQSIKEISNITWTENVTGLGNNFSLQVSVDNGINWYMAVNGNGLTGFSSGSSLTYRALFNLTNSGKVSLLDLNIDWLEPPKVEIVYPETYTYNYQITELNYTVSVAAGENLDTCWYTLDSGSTNTTITCGDNVTGITSVDGENVWRVYANDSSGSIGFDIVNFSIDTSAPNITFINQTDEDWEIVDSTNPLNEGENLTIRTDVDDGNLDSVWVVVWENVVGGVEKVKKFFTYFAGFSLWMTTVQTDSSWINNVYNYTIFANDTTGLISNYSGEFEVLHMNSTLSLSPNPSAGVGEVNATGSLSFSNGSALGNHAINLWLDGALLLMDDLTNNGNSENYLNLTKGFFFSDSTYDNVYYDGENVTLEGTNTTGNLTGLVDAGAIVDWGSFSWDYVGEACSGSVDYIQGQNGFTGTTDAYISSGSPTANYGDEEFLSLDTSPDIEKGILRFDIFGYGKNLIPYGATINSASMSVNIFDTGDTATVYEVLENWNENYVSYNARLSGTTWTTSGVEPPSRATTIEDTVSMASTGFASFSVLNAMQRWSAGISENYGIIFQPGGASGARFRSSEYSIVGERPMMNISFSSADCTSVRVLIRTSNDKSSWSSWEELDNSEEILASSRYLEYRIELSSFNESMKPYLENILLNYSAVTTDSSGNFNYEFNSPSGFGNYPVEVTSGYKTIFTNSSATLFVQSGVEPNVELYSPDDFFWFNDSNIVLVYNASDLNGDFNSSYLVLNGVLNETNQSEIINGLNNFTIILNEGIYNWSVNLTDSANNVANSSTRNFYVDLQNPEVHLVSPEDYSTHLANSVDLIFNATDNLDSVLSCDVVLDSNVIYSGILVNSSESANVSSGSLSGGIHFWNVSCVDNSSRTGLSETWAINITDTPPNVTLILPTDGYVDSDGNVSFMFNPTDNSGIKNCSLIVNDNFVKGNETEILLGQNNTINYSFASEGFYNWTVECFDLSDSGDKAIPRNISVDLNPPNISLVFPLDESESNSSIVNFSFIASDFVDSSLNCSIEIGGVLTNSFEAISGELTNILVGNLSDGIKLWNVTCTDDSAHENTSATWSVDIKEPPQIFLNTSNETSEASNSIILEYTPVDNGNFSSCNVYINGILNQTNSSEVLNGEINNFEISGLADGTYPWFVNCSDLVGLSNASEERIFYIDNFAPLINLSYPVEEDVYGVNITFNFTVIDLVDSTLNCSINVSGSEVDNFIAINGTMSSRSVSGISDGFHDWVVSCSDSAGNFNTSITTNFTKLTNPGVVLIYPDDGEWFNYSAIDLTYLPQDDEGILYSELFINGIYNQTNSTPIVNGDNNLFSIDFPDGVYNWSVQVFDVSGLPTNSSIRTFYIDTTPPEVLLNYPEQDEVVTTNNVSFNYSVYDYVDLELECNLTLNSDVEDSRNATSGEDNLVYIPISDGNYSWAVVCIDQANNTNQTAGINFSVLAPPNVTLDSPANDFATIDSNITFVYTPYDAIGITNCSFYLDGILNETNESIFANNQNFFLIDGIGEGEHNWSVECFDFDSNGFMPAPLNFTRDITPPNIILNGPSNNSGIDINDGEIYFNWTAIDTYDDVLQCNLTIGGNVVEEDQWVSSNVSHVEQITGLGEGYYEWNVTCWDQLKNVNTSESRFFNLTEPDFYVEEINFNSTSPYEGETILINATIRNLGGADSDNVLVGFYDGDPSSGGTNLENATINIDRNETLFVASEFIGEIGDNEIFVTVDYGDSFIEFNETNNILSKNLNIGSWEFFYGDILSTSEYELAGNESKDLIKWDAANFENGNLFVSDSESLISWGDLIEIGRKTDGGNSTNDFTEIDALLNMSGLTDSVSSVYTTAGEINNLTSLLVFGKSLDYVPIADSINNSNFVTGILWDSSDDSNGEFDSGEKEDLVYVAKVNPDSAGAYGIYDYELRVPAKLREYDNANSDSVVFYVELW